MRLLLYNIRYGTGSKRRRLPWVGYFGRTTENLDAIITFIKSQSPDIVGLVEVDAGSYRSRGRNQAATIAEALGHYHSYSSKYGKLSFAHGIPILNKQGNAFLTRDTVVNERFHYFERGIKRLVIELELENLVIFLVHLALGFRVRHSQLSDLYSLVKETEKPLIVAGDFNTRWGDKEIRLFLAATGLTPAGPPGGAPTFPSWAPRRRPDFILHSRGVRPTGYSAPNVLYSDHLPLVFDFELPQK